uniref:SH3 domain-containing protein n=1 Tax=Heterorhabditis bacteriophora TaxID=37862 RepID=A0A1I7XTH3_HETBA
MDQPLYQIYMMEEHEKLIDDVNSHDTTEELARADDSEERERKIKSRRESSASSDSGRGADCSTSASALTSNTSMRRERLIASSHFGSQRSLWCELPEVITSEASYLRSLNILITHFMASQELMGSKSSLSVITNAERKHLFSNIFAVRDCSERFVFQLSCRILICILSVYILCGFRLLCDLETRLEENLVLDDLCDFLVDHFEKNFDVYVKYCSNQVYQDRTLRRLKSENNNFLSAVSRLEADKQCQGLDMRSFLMLPMQRVTRYPLLMYAIIDRLPIDSERYKVASRALNAANKVVRECNEGARRMERTEQLLEVDRRLVYKDPDLKRIPLVSNSRHLVKRGPLVQLIERRTKGILQARQKSRGLHIFLFSDIIMITKKRLNGTYECKDYAARRYVDVEPIEAGNTKIPSGALSSLTSCPHLFICILMRNARGKHTELLFNADSETDRERWLSAIRPPTSLNPEEKVYAEWDCPQAIAVHNYSKNQDDELDVQVGDTVNILRKMPDGWFYGERTRDGAGGWFPSSYVQQILNDHVRANNYRQRLRLIQMFYSVIAFFTIALAYAQYDDLSIIQEVLDKSTVLPGQIASHFVSDLISNNIVSNQTASSIIPKHTTIPILPNKTGGSVLPSDIITNNVVSNQSTNTQKLTENATLTDITLLEKIIVSTESPSTKSESSSSELNEKEELVELIKETSANVSEYTTTAGNEWTENSTASIELGTEKQLTTEKSIISTMETTITPVDSEDSFFGMLKPDLATIYRRLFPF